MVGGFDVIEVYNSMAGYVVKIQQTFSRSGRGAGVLEKKRGSSPPEFAGQ